MVDVNKVVDVRYKPNNPVYKDIITNFVNSELYTSALDVGPAVTPSVKGNILTCKNGAGVPNSAIALEVIADGISSAILKQLRDGLNGSVDTALNIDLETKTSTNTVINTEDNVHSALIKLSNEVAALHKAITTAFTSLGQAQIAATMETEITVANAAVDVETTGKKIKLN